MVFEGIVEIVANLVLYVGLPLLVILFFLEGLIVGKVFQPPAVFVTVVAIATPSIPALVLLNAGCTLSVVAGQWTTYRSFNPDSPEFVGIRARWPAIAALPHRAVERIGEKRFRMVDRLFERFGGIGIVVTTFVPGIRGLLAVPAGMSSYPRRRFLVFTLLGNTVYFPVLVAVAYGILHVFGL